MHEQIGNVKKHPIRRVAGYVVDHSWTLAFLFLGLPISSAVILMAINEKLFMFFLVFIWCPFWLLFFLLGSFLWIYSEGFEEGFNSLEPKTVIIQDTWPSHIFHACKTLILLSFVLFLSPWFIMYRLGKWKGKRKYGVLNDRQIQEDAERIRISEQRKYTRRYYDDPTDPTPNAYGYDGINGPIEEVNWIPEKIFNDCGRSQQKSNAEMSRAQKEAIKTFLKGLTQIEKVIVVLYYDEEMTMPEIAKSLELSSSVVLRMHSSIIRRCKSHLCG